MAKFALKKRKPKALICWYADPGHVSYPWKLKPPTPCGGRQLVSPGYYGKEPKPGLGAPGPDGSLYVCEVHAKLYGGSPDCAPNLVERR